MLSNLKRQPDFHYQFLMHKKLISLNPEDQLQFDQVYDIIED